MIHDGELRFIGNATVLLRYADLTILTDPNFVPKGTEVPLGYGMSTRRLTNPAITIDELPTVDLVVLSHYHGDHFDQLAEERLPRAIPIVTTPEASARLADRGFEATTPLETWATHERVSPGGRLRLTALPAKHAPAGLSVALPDVMGSYLELWQAGGVNGIDGEPDLRLYVSGDTILFEGLRDIGERLPAVDLALIHLGGTRVLGVTVTLDGEHGAELVDWLRPQRVVPIHVNDYEAFKSPLGDFVRAIGRLGHADRVEYLRHGDVLALPRRGVVA